VSLLFLAGVVGYRIGQPDRPGAGSADVGFLQDMIVHHEQAIALSYRTVNEATDLEVRGFAKDILVSQQYEIGLMEAYLTRWDHPRDSGKTVGMAWAGTPHPKGAMVGMATVQEQAALERATGPEVDDRFLRLMIAHHHGGVLMGEAILRRSQDAEVRELATRIVTAQRSEIAEMQATRRRLGLPRAEEPAVHGRPRTG
jgi:uncharacterized protein (DUF305 family)